MLFIKRFLPEAKNLKLLQLSKKEGEVINGKAGRNVPALVLVGTAPFRIKEINPPFKAIWQAQPIMWIFLLHVFPG